MNIDTYNLIKEKTKEYEQEIYDFASKLIQVESFSGKEGALAKVIEAKMLELKYDSVTVDSMGNVLGLIGTKDGKHPVICVDGHMDVVEYGDMSEWIDPPLSGKQDEKNIYGRGAADMKSAISAMVYAGKIIKDLKLDTQFSYMACATVQEEPCEGLAWEYLIEQENIKPDLVILGEPSDGEIALAQRGRMELLIKVQGKSAHAANPKQGDNAIYKMAKIVSELEELNDSLNIEDVDLGKGCLVVSEISSTSNSRSSVADSCTISVDRRLTWGESPEYALNQIKSLPSVLQAQAVVEPYIFTEPSYTQKSSHKECVFHAWKVEKDSKLAQIAVKAHENIFEKNASLTAWPFSTNGVAIMGKHNIPVIGYGPGTLVACHVPNEFVAKQQIFDSTLFFITLAYQYSVDR